MSNQDAAKDQNSNSAHPHDGEQDDSGGYRKGSLTLAGAVSMGTGVMIGAGIFALTGQIAKLAGQWFPLAFLAAAGVAGVSSYAYVKMSNAHPSAGGIAMYLKQAYGKGATTAGMGLLMYFSMVINESLVARTFGSYTMQLFAGPDQSGGTSAHGAWIPALGVGMLLFALVINLVGNKIIDKLSLIMAVVKIGGIMIFALAGLWASGFDLSGLIGSAGAGDAGSQSGASGGWLGFLAATTLGVLAYKGFTTITNDGGEIKSPRKNVGKAIVISLGICIIIYTLVTLAVGGNLSIKQIIAAQDYSLAEAARPAFGKWGLWLTVALAMVATVGGVIASVFAVSRMLAMLVKMELVPFARLSIPGRMQYATLVYTIGLAILLTVLFDLSRIASLGAIFYLVMDIAVQWGVLRHLRKEIKANPAIIVLSIVLDVAILAAFVWVKVGTDPIVLVIAAAGILVIFVCEKIYLRNADAAPA